MELRILLPTPCSWNALLTVVHIISEELDDFEVEHVYSRSDNSIEFKLKKEGV